MSQLQRRACDHEMYVRVSMSVCLCVCEGERETEWSERGKSVVACDIFMMYSLSYDVLDSLSSSVT